MQLLDQDQLAVFQKVAAKDRLHALYVPATDSGTRRGELFALFWSDVALIAGLSASGSVLKRSTVACA
jgi:hypothetical protein